MLLAKLPCEGVFTEGKLFDRDGVEGGSIARRTLVLCL
jgi:hypothetical protein